jgi:hypothetical protein
MARKKAFRKAETRLVLHKNNSALLKKAESGVSAKAVKAYLDAGGLADAIVPCAEPDMPQFPLLHHMVFTNAHPHSELAECVSLLLAAGVDINATFPEKCVIFYFFYFTALLCVASCTCCSAVVDVLLRAG